MIHRTVPRKLNKDTDERLLRFDEMKDALNVLVKSSSDGDDGVVKMAEGNEIISFISGDSLPAGTNTVIGSVTDEDSLVIYFFVHNNTGQHSVCGYSSSMNKCFVVYSNPGLAFQENGFVKADIVKNRRVEEIGDLVIDAEYEQPIIDPNFGNEGGGDEGQDSIFAREVNWRVVLDMSFEMTKRSNAIGRDYYGNTRQALQDVVSGNQFISVAKFVTNAGDEAFYNPSQDIANDPDLLGYLIAASNYTYQEIDGKDCLVIEGKVHVDPTRIILPGAKLEIQTTITSTDIIGDRDVFGFDDVIEQIDTIMLFQNTNTASNPVILDSEIMEGSPVGVGMSGPVPLFSDMISNPSTAFQDYGASILILSSNISSVTNDPATGLNALGSAGAQPTFEDAFLKGRLRIDFSDSIWHQTGATAVDQEFPSISNDYTGINNTTGS